MSEALEDKEIANMRQAHHSKQDESIRLELGAAVQKIRSLEAQNAQLVDSKQVKIEELKCFPSMDYLKAPAGEVSPVLFDRSTI